jgi:hypothetical protein
MKGMLFVIAVWRCVTGGEGLGVVLHMQGLRLWDVWCCYGDGSETLCC